MSVKKIILAGAIFFALSAAGFSKAKKSDTANGKLKIVATIFPQYDWTRELLGENAGKVELTLLVENGVDLHSYQPSIQDIAKISTADIFIFVGGESDAWVKAALKNTRNKNMTVINMMEILGERVKAEEIKEGMQSNEDEEADDETEYDEHVWLSLRNAKYLSSVIADAICQKDSANEDLYRANLASYVQKLDSLDNRYTDVVKSGSKKTLLFGDRFPFRYLTDDYNLDYYAAFAGCSAETEASFETVIFLSKKTDELGLNTVFKIESGDGKIARTIIQNCKNKNARVLALNSMQSVTKTDIQAGETYINIMKKNLEVLKEALK